MDFIQQKQLLTNLTLAQEETISYYHNNDMAMLRKICDPIIYRKGVPPMDYDELYDVASDTLLESLGTYDESKGSQFSTYLIGNIKRAFYDWTRDQRRFKRCNLTEERDKDGNLVKDKNGKQKYVVIADISIDAPIGDESESTLADMLPSGFDLESELAEEIGISSEESFDDYSPQMQEYLHKLSNVQRKILDLLSQGYSPEEIIEILHIDMALYKDSIVAITSYKYTRIIKKCRGE